MWFVALALLFSEHLLETFGNETVTGFALQQGAFVYWGDRLLWRSSPTGECRVLRGRESAPLRAACLFDVDRDGHPDVVASEGDALVWFHWPNGARYVIDSGAASPDLLPATLFGRRGVLLIHKHQQVRFYDVPRRTSAPWPYRDIYSIYTPSWQGGLRLADIDGDGRPDILCGDYWIRSPRRFDLPWRLFAVHTWTEEERSGMLRLAWAGGVLAAAQRAMAPARVAWFERPPDPRVQWPQHRLGEDLALAMPDSVEMADFDGDGRPDILVAEAGGRGRVVIFRNQGGGRYVPETVAAGGPVLQARVADVNGDGRPDILVLRRAALAWLENRTPARR